MDAPKRGTLDISTAGTAAKGHNYFLGIGVDAYAHFPALANARKDVEDLRDLLVQHYYFDLSHTTLLCGAEASRKNILRQLNQYRKTATADDRLLLYYAGHGLFDGNLGFWIPAEAERDDISGYVSNADLREIMRSIPARHILLISDSCFSASLMVRDASRGAGGSAFEDFERNASRWVFISGKGVVSDGQPGHNSPFADAILKHLRQNPTEALNIAQLADQVTKEVRFNYEQQAEASPLYQAGHAGGQFVFQKRQTERDDWQKAQQAGTEGAFLAFLGKYPDSVYAPEAENQLAELADEIAWRKAVLKDSAYDYRQYLKKYAQGRHATEAKEKLAGYEAEEQTRQQEEAARLEQERLALIKKQETDRVAREKEAAERARQQQEDVRLEQERQALLQKQAEERAVRERQAVLQQQADERQALRHRETAGARQDHSTPPSFLRRHGLALIVGGVVLALFIIWQVSRGAGQPNRDTQTARPENTRPLSANEKQGGTPANSNKTDKNITPGKETATQTGTGIKTAPKTDIKNSRPTQKDPVTTKQTNIPTQQQTPKEDPKPATPSFEREKALKLVQTALTYLKAGEYDDAKKSINAALLVNNLPINIQNDLKSARAQLNAEEYGEVRIALQAAVSKCQ